MAKKKARENYGNGSITPVMVKKLDRDGNPIIDKKTGKPVMTQKKDRRTGKPTWRICLTLGYEKTVDKNGNPRKRQKKVQQTYHGTLKQAREEAKKLVDTYQDVNAEHADDNFSHLVDEWANDTNEWNDDNGNPTCAEHQKNEYLRLLGYVAAHLDDKSVVELKRVDVEKALTLAAQRPNGKTLAPTTKKKMRNYVHRVFEYGVDLEYLPKNPCRKPRRKRYGTAHGSVTQRRALTEEQAHTLCSYLDDVERQAMEDFKDKEERQEKWGNRPERTLVRGLSEVSCIVAVRLILSTGVRRGECLGLQWTNVDLEKGIIRICQSLSEDNELKSPKTDNGIRNMYVDDRTIEHLRKLKDFQRDALSHLYVDGIACEQEDSTPVFSSDNGKMMEPTNFSRWWRKFRAGIADKHEGFENLLIHELRHSQKTYLLTYHPNEEGLIDTRMGHARQSAMTLVYGHEKPAMDKHLAKTIGDILYGVEVTGTKETDRKPLKLTA